MNISSARRGLAFSADPLTLDNAAETDRIVAGLREQLRGMRKRGLVLGLSGGIDSSVSVARSPPAPSARRTSSACSCRKATPIPRASARPARSPRPSASKRSWRISARRCARWAAMSGATPSSASWCPNTGRAGPRRSSSPNSLAGDGYNISSLVVQDPEGRQTKLRMPPAVYLGIVAATNMKQRTRKQIEYYHADRLNFAVLGTPNRLEYDQGFFVKNGDGAADVKPIAHLYKSQVYALAAHLGVPEEIRRRPPTTDTYSLAQTQEEFYFALPYDRMDLCLFGLNNGLSAVKVGAAAESDARSRSNASGPISPPSAGRRAICTLAAARPLPSRKSPAEIGAVEGDGGLLEPLPGQAIQLFAGQPA